MNENQYRRKLEDRRKSFRDFSVEDRRAIDSDPMPRLEYDSEEHRIPARKHAEYEENKQLYNV